MKYIAIALALFLAGCQASQTAPEEDASPVSDLESMLEGKVVTFEYGAKATYDSDGSYTYRGSGETYRGEYEIEQNTVCVTFDDLESRCDDYVQVDEDYYVVNQDGNYYRITDITDT